LFEITNIASSLILIFILFYFIFQKVQLAAPLFKYFQKLKPGFYYENQMPNTTHPKTFHPKEQTSCKVLHLNNAMKFGMLIILN